jgi:hypothetical protein
MRLLRILISGCFVVESFGEKTVEYDAKTKRLLIVENDCKLEIAVEQRIRDEQQKTLREAVGNHEEIDACLAIPGQGTVREHFNVRPVRAIGHRSLERDDLQCVETINYPYRSDIVIGKFSYPIKKRPDDQNLLGYCQSMARVYKLVANIIQSTLPK